MNCKHCGKKLDWIKIDIATEKLMCPDACTAKPSARVPYANTLWASGAYKSYAMAVHPDQRQEASEYAAKHGVPTNYDANGQPEIMDRNHRKKLARIHGMHDNNAGYGDATPN